jgi:thiamine-phosphate pyrophosphorylase
VRLDLPKIYPITDTQLSGLSHAEQVSRLIEGGASLIQLRDKSSAARVFYGEATAALRIARAHGARLIINDRVDIALALKADGVHLGQTDIPVAAARHLLGPDAIIGFSTHSLEQVKLASALPVDYLAFGPIFPTLSKNTPEPTTGLIALSEVVTVNGLLPLVGIGGIRVENTLDVLKAGADSVAVIAELVADPTKITENMSKMLSVTRSVLNNRSES